MCCGEKPMKSGEVGPCIAGGLFFVALSFGATYAVPLIVALGAMADILLGSSLIGVISLLAIAFTTRRKRHRQAQGICIS